MLINLPYFSHFSHPPLCKGRCPVVRAEGFLVGGVNRNLPQPPPLPTGRQACKGGGKDKAFLSQIN